MIISSSTVSSTDYGAVNETVTLTSCEKLHCVNLSIINDFLNEPVETFSLSLTRSPDTPPFILVTPAAGEVIITDDDHDDEGLKVLSAEQLSNISLQQNPELLRFAVWTGETVTVEISAAEQGVIIQEGVTVVLNCSQWLRNIPGGTVRWFRYLYLDIDHTQLSSPVELIPQYVNMVLVQRETITGVDNEIFTIVRSLISEDAEDSTRGIYQCMVCADQLSNSEVCHGANTTIATVGRPPIIEVGVGTGAFH